MKNEVPYEKIALRFSRQKDFAFEKKVTPVFQNTHIPRKYLLLSQQLLPILHARYFPPSITQFCKKILIILLHKRHYYISLLLFIISSDKIRSQFCDFITSRKVWVSLD